MKTTSMKGILKKRAKLIKVHNGDGEHLLVRMIRSVCYLTYDDKAKRVVWNYIDIYYNED